MKKNILLLPLKTVNSRLKIKVFIIKRQEVVLISINLKEYLLI